LSDDAKTVRILYKNYKGETAWRAIVPQKVRFASNEWHPQEQWLLDAFDLEKNAARSFAMDEIREWKAGA
jgi:predicted DNA-binding transcriptional regulator YafY